jgi:hypothetical protein
MIIRWLDLNWDSRFQGIEEVEVNELGIEGKGIFYEVEELIRIYFFLEDFK